MNPRRKKCAFVHTSQHNRELPVHQWTAHPPCLHSLRYRWQVHRPFATSQNPYSSLIPTGPPIIVDTSFRPQFEVAGLPADAAYIACVAALPATFVGTLGALVPLVHVMSAALEREAQQLSLELPPWRSRPALLSKWLPTRFTDCIYTPPSVQLHPLLRSLQCTVDTASQKLTHTSSCSRNTSARSSVCGGLKDCREGKAGERTADREANDQEVAGLLRPPCARPTCSRLLSRCDTGSGESEMGTMAACGTSPPAAHGGRGLGADSSPLPWLALEDRATAHAVVLGFSVPSCSPGGLGPTVNAPDQRPIASELQPGRRKERAEQQQQQHQQLCPQLRSASMCLGQRCGEDTGGWLAGCGLWAQSAVAARSADEWQKRNAAVGPPPECSQASPVVVPVPPRSALSLQLQEIKRRHLGLQQQAVLPIKPQHLQQQQQQQQEQQHAGGGQRRADLAAVKLLQRAAQRALQQRQEKHKGLLLPQCLQRHEALTLRE